jgi:tetratricopeptide (TPR) repeat protein
MPKETIPELLSNAGAAYTRGDLATAARLYHQVVDRNPDCVDALNFGGLCRFMLGDQDRGIEKVRRAADLAGESDHRILNNLGGMLKATGDLAAAQNAYQQLIQFSPGYAPGHYNLGNVFQARGELAAAEQCYRRALEIQPRQPAARANLGYVLLQRGRSEVARCELEQAIGLDANNVDAHNSLGTAQAQLGHLEAAQHSYREALRLKPDHTHALNNLGNLLSESDNNKLALDYYRRALATGQAGLRTEDNLGAALTELGQFDAAIACHRATLDRHTNHWPARQHLAKALAGNHEFADAEQELKQAIVASKSAGSVIYDQIALQWRQQHFDAAQQTLRSGLQANSTSAWLLAAQQLLQQQSQTPVPLDWNQLYRVVELSEDQLGPAGYASVERFNTALTEHIQGHPSLNESPNSHATRNGQHSGELFLHPMGPVAVLRQLLQEQSGSYLKAHQNAPGMPSIGQQWRYTAWAVVMRDQGHQIAHIHPSAWLSAVYYVEVPEAVDRSGDQRQGWLEFGSAPEELPPHSALDTRQLRPQPGRLVLFPSWLWHRTIPFRGQRRICVAFDVMQPAS